MPLSSEARTALVFRADTSQARREISKLAATNKATAAEQVAAQKTVEKSLTDQIAVIGKVATGAFAAVGAFRAMQGAAEKYAKVSQLTFAAGEADIKGIQKASRGLLTEMQSLEVAAALQNGAFEVTNEQMATAAKAMVSLRNQGNDWNEVIKEVTKSLVEGNTEGLTKFGIEAGKGAKTAEGFADALSKLEKEAAKTAATTDLAGDATKRAGVQWTDAITDLVVSFGKLADTLATKLAPVLDTLTNAVKGITFGLDLITSPGQALNQLGGSGEFRARSGTALHIARGSKTFNEIAARARAGVQGQLQSEGTVALFSAGLDALVAIGEGAKKVKRTTGGGAGGGGAPRLATVTPGGPGRGSLGATSLGHGGGAFAGAFAGGEAFGRGLELGGMAQQLREEVQPAILDFEMVAVTAFQHVADAASASLASMISGADSGIAAFHKLAAGVLNAVGAQLLGFAISESVKSAIAAAGFDFPGAARHATAATIAKAGAAGVGALIVGRLVAGSGSSGGGGGAIPSGGAGAVSGVNPGRFGSNTSIFVGDNFFGDNPRANASRISRHWQRSRQSEGDESVIVYS